MQPPNVVGAWSALPVIFQTLVSALATTAGFEQLAIDDQAGPTRYSRPLVDVELGATSRQGLIVADDGSAAWRLAARRTETVTTAAFLQSLAEHVDHVLAAEWPFCDWVRVRSVLSSLSPNCLAHRERLSDRLRTYSIEWLQRREAQLTAAELSIATLFAERWPETADALRGRLTRQCKAAGLTPRGVTNQMKALITTLGRAGLVRDGQFEPWHLSPKLLEQWATEHNWWMGQIGLPHRQVLLPVALLSEPRTLVERLKRAALPETFERRLIAGSSQAYQWLATSSFRSWTSEFQLQSRLTTAVRSADPGRAFARFIVIEEAAIQSQLTAYTVLEIVVRARSGEEAIRMLTDRVAQLTQINRGNAIRLASALVKRVIKLANVTFGSDRTAHELPGDNLRKVRAGSMEWLRRLEKVRSTLRTVET